MYNGQIRKKIEMLWNHFFQPDSNIVEDNERANMTIKVKMDKCTDFQDVNCISSVTLTYQNSIVKMEREKLFINHVDYSETIRSTPYSFNGIYVKEVTNKFRVVKAFGLKILYDKRRTLYIDLKPFYANKVSPVDGMQIANVLFKRTALREQEIPLPK